MVNQELHTGKYRNDTRISSILRKPPWSCYCYYDDSEPFSPQKLYYEWWGRGKDVRNVPLSLRRKGLWLQLMHCAPYMSMSQDLNNGDNLRRPHVVYKAFSLAHFALSCCDQDKFWKGTSKVKTNSRDRDSQKEAKEIVTRDEDTTSRTSPTT
ncbi:hypothetical protein K503DRAFT_787534 [Rhizopogon vinicolor AM-OR11-026]|uniref:Uncharacterized protein n=1 Tax=Rhizopogon vinicolor AM-OR11-026 TaxID=1314800 RepID=A0A1B7MH41_9AGAM|nr:hypothetical protein K503DRAFT_787534 [Rhizopogon vinicolor AM-OR11-026]